MHVYISIHTYTHLFICTHTHTYAKFRQQCAWRHPTRQPRLLATNNCLMRRGLGLRQMQVELICIYIYMYTYICIYIHVFI